MVKLTLYKSVKEYVSKQCELPEEVKTFLEYQTNQYQNSCYIDCEEDLKGYFGEDENEQFKIVANWFKENNLYEMDLDLEE